MIKQRSVQFNTAQNHGRLGLVLLFAFCVTILLLRPPQVAATGAVHYVKPAASGIGNGTSWTDATTLQDAIGDAVGGDEIWVAAGTYIPGPDESYSFHLVPGVALYGGFAGIETVKEERDWVANLTVLSGDIHNDDINKVNGVVTEAADIVGGNSDNVVFADGTTGTPISAETIFDGFTITAGQGSGSGIDNSGGGFKCIGAGSECSPSLTNIFFSGNTAGFGGAMYNFGLSGNSSPSLTNVSFSGNTANRGGAMYNFGWGGRGSPNLTNVSFSRNTSNLGSAMYNDCDGSGSECSPSLTNVTFSDNTGSAIYSYCNYGSKCNPTLTNVSFSDNTRIGGGGGAMLNECKGAGSECSPSLTNVSFSNNSAFFGGAMVNTGSFGGISSPSLTNVSFSGNSAENGGAMYNHASGGITSPSLTNVVMWGDSATSAGPEILNIGDGVTTIITYSLIEGMHPLGTGNLDGTIASNAPLFLDPANGNLRLQDSSPAIDAGDNDAPGLAGILSDLDGSDRFVDGDGDGTETIDMGVYEYVPTQEIALAGGWSMISLFVQPEDLALEAVLAGIETEIVLLKNGQGQLYWPAFGIDQIGGWLMNDGYEIYLNAPVTLSVSGTQVRPAQLLISVQGGWNMVAYLRDSDLAIETALDGISSDLLLVKNADGRVYWPAMGINEIGSMEPGHGYQMYMTQAAALTYPPN